ncbi:ATP-dependent DNA helicase Hrp3 [Mycoemilia scoparia]|uniref:ATP-dependent DNA helicase Hrp3 n=1 Tax=Mycoemilia scoparia TaxID=417184 RepID=A0A9W7ZQB7_9FUNG|nr:ATP-dependent DNA helicase Hrp3 [Mycoemilia scoparia]
MQSDAYSNNKNSFNNNTATATTNGDNDDNDSNVRIEYDSFEEIDGSGGGNIYQDNRVVNSFNSNNDTTTTTTTTTVTLPPPLPKQGPPPPMVTGVGRNRQTIIDDDDDDSLSDLSDASITSSNDDDSSYGGGVANRDKDFTISESELSYESSGSITEDDPSDEDWEEPGLRSRKRKTATTTTTTRRGGGVNKKKGGFGAGNKKSKNLPNSGGRWVESYASRDSDESDDFDSDDSEYFEGRKKKKSKKFGTGGGGGGSSSNSKLKRGKLLQRKFIADDFGDYSSSEAAAGGSSTGRMTPKRASARNVKVKSYNEADNGFYSDGGGLGGESDHGDSELDDQRSSVGTGTKSKTKVIEPVVDEPDPNLDIIEAVRDFRVREDLVDNGDDKVDKSNSDNLEFYIKWKGWSYRHATWDTVEYLRDFKGFKKVENYIRQTVMGEYYFLNDPQLTSEDIEQFNINKELERNVIKDYQNVERIYASREGRPRVIRQPGDYGDGSEPKIAPAETEYLVKWKRLPYNASTWEPHSEISEHFQTEIDSFLDRSQSQCVPHRSASLSVTGNRRRPAFKRILTQPEYLVGGELRDYQLTSLNWMAHLWCNNENGILADEMGLGKTVQSTSFLSYLFHTQNIYGPFLVVVPLSTIGSWQREMKKWAPDMNVIAYIEDSRSRSIMREYEFFLPASNVNSQPRVKFNVLLTTYELVLKDRDFLGSIKWAFLLVDEAHRLKNSESALHDALSSFHTTNRLLITGTPLQNSVKELVTLCRFLMPDKFQDMDDDFDINSAVQDPNHERKITQLHTQLKPYMLRRLKKDVEKSLPQKTERILRVELAPMQVHYYKNILTRNYQVLNRGVSGPGQLSLLNIMTELKKASNHPYLFPNAENLVSSNGISTKTNEEQLKGIVMNSGKMVLLDKLLTRLKQGGHRVLIFSQMVRMLDIMADYMAIRGYAYQRLDGSIGSEQRKKSIEHFNAEGSPDFVFLLSTRAGGLGINLETADTVIIFDSDWNPQNDLQAMARAHRIGQKKQVSVYRFVSKGTVEEDILERAKRKMVLEYCIIKGMDTSGLHLTASERKHIEKGSVSGGSGGYGYGSGKIGGGNGAPFSKDELSAILKFGASSMFANDSNNNNNNNNGDGINNQQQNKLNNMDLDAILADAEQTETTTAGAADDFLSQFQVADYALDTQNMSWEDIIPEDERKKIEEEERAAAEAEILYSRRRTRVSYAEDGTRLGGSDDDDDDDINGDGGLSDGDGSKAAKRRRRGGAAVHGGGSKDTNEGDPGSLSEKDIRALIRSIQRFGDPQYRYAEVVKDAELARKNKDIIKKVSTELIKTCEDAVRQHFKDSSGNDVNSAAAAAAGGGGTGGDDDPASQLRRNAKAILITYRDITSINAGVVTQRVVDLRHLVNKLKLPPLDTEPTKFRLNVPLKPVQNWTSTWGQREDAMLLVGIYRHGFGNWEKIQHDPDLGLTKKMFSTTADEKAAKAKVLSQNARGGGASKLVIAPKPTHLVRRGEYLLKVLKESEERKTGAPKSKGSAAGSSPAAPSRSARKRAPGRSSTSTAAEGGPHPPSKSSRSRGRASGASSSSKRGGDNGTGNGKEVAGANDQNTAEGNEDGQMSDPESMDESECKSLMKPVKKYLQRLRNESDTTTSKSGKIKLVRDCLLPIGRHIRSTIQRRESRGETQSDIDTLYRHLWVFATYFWSRPIGHKQLMEIFIKLEQKTMGSSNSGAGGGVPGDAEKSPSILPASPTNNSRSHGGGGGRHRQYPGSPTGGSSRSGGRHDRDNQHRSSSVQKRQQGRSSYGSGRQPDSGNESNDDGHDNGDDSRQRKRSRHSHSSSSGRHHDRDASRGDYRSPSKDRGEGRPNIDHYHSPRHNRYSAEPSKPHNHSTHHHHHNRHHHEGGGGSHQHNRNNLPNSPTSANSGGSGSSSATRPQFNS